MDDDPLERAQKIRDEIVERARGVEDNPVVPGEPTLVGLMTTMLDEIALLRARLEDLEARG